MSFVLLGTNAHASGDAATRQRAAQRTLGQLRDVQRVNRQFTHDSTPVIVDESDTLVAPCRRSRRVTATKIVQPLRRANAWLRHERV